MSWNQRTFWRANLYQQKLVEKSEVELLLVKFFQQFSGFSAKHLWAPSPPTTQSKVTMASSSLPCYSGTAEPRATGEGLFPGFPFCKHWFCLSHLFSLSNHIFISFSPFQIVLAFHLLSYPFLLSSHGILHLGISSCWNFQGSRTNHMCLATFVAILSKKSENFLYTIWTIWSCFS